MEGAQDWEGLECQGVTGVDMVLGVEIRGSWGVGGSMSGEGGLWGLGKSETLCRSRQYGMVMGSGIEESAVALWSLGIWHGRG